MPLLSERLGYRPDQRLLLVNADDFGMCHAENVATIEGLLAGTYDSSTLMVPCPWFAEAVEMVKPHPHLDLGAHLTQTSEWSGYRWSPVAGTPLASLTADDGCFPQTVEQVYRRADLREIEIETRAQVERALACGLDLTHLDSHMGTMQLRADYHALYVRIAADYRLPIRMAERTWLANAGMQSVLDLIAELGVLTPDHFNYGGPPDPNATAAYWTKLFHSLQPGVTEIYVHAARPDPELQAMSERWQQRSADHEFFSAASTRALFEQLDIIRIGYRRIRELQRSEPR